MAKALDATPARDFEDSAVRLAAEGELSNRAIVKKYIKQSYTLTDGPNSGNTADYFQEEIATSASGGTSVVTGSATPADAAANPTNTVPSESFLMSFNGTTWDRVRSAGVNTDALGNTTNGIIRVIAHSDIYNGTGWDRGRSASGANNTATTSLGAVQVAALGSWTLSNAPADNTQATASKAAGGGTVRHVCTGVSFSAVSTGASTAVPVTFVLRDGATGAGTVLMTWKMMVPATVAGNGGTFGLQGMNVTGSANTAMTIETTAAGGANTAVTVNLTGYSTP